MSNTMNKFKCHASVSDSVSPNNNAQATSTVRSLRVSKFEDTAKYMAKVPLKSLQVPCDEFLYWWLLRHVLQKHL